MADDVKQTVTGQVPASSVDARNSGTAGGKAIGSCAGGCLLYLLVVICIVGGTWTAGKLEHRFVQRRVIDATYGPGSFAKGVHVVNKRGDVSNGTQLPGFQRFILDASYVATTFAAFIVLVLAAHALFPHFFADERDQGG